MRRRSQSQFQSTKHRQNHDTQLLNLNMFVQVHAMNDNDVNNTRNSDVNYVYDLLLQKKSRNSKSR